MCDKLVFDLAQEVEGSPSVFVRKDWINILDNQTSNYTSNQSVVDTSQLSNSNKYMSYRESYFLVPLTLTLASLGDGIVTNTATAAAYTNVEALADLTAQVMQPLGGGGMDNPATVAQQQIGLDNAIGLKNWFGNIIHSFTLDYNGSTIIQQTPFVNMWNSFKLMTSLSYNDVITQGCTIGFWPDDAESFSANFQAQFAAVPAVSRGADQVPTCTLSGNGIVNNNCSEALSAKKFVYQNFNSGAINNGLQERLKWISYDDQCNLGLYQEGERLANLLDRAACSQLWKSYIVKKQNQVPLVAAGGAITQTAVGVGLLQYGIIATVYLKHIHSFFNMCPLLKGVFMKMTMNLNNSASTVLVGSSASLAAGAAVGKFGVTKQYSICTASSSALGGVNPIMLSSNGFTSGAQNLSLSNFNTAAIAAAAGYIDVSQKYRLSLSVGNTCLDAQTTQLGATSQDMACKSIYLYIPAYTFNPPFEQAYISSPVKSIKYTDIYQYQVLGVGATGQFNNLLTNGIANIKSVLILPFYSTQNDANSAVIPNIYNGAITLPTNTGFINGTPVWMSPFDPAGTGATSPLCHFSNFNVQVSGQNSIYNLQLRSFEEFNNQLYGQNAVNGGLTDGITSSLVDRQSFDMEYCYYYVNVERMLPVEQSVPKSIQILGTNYSKKKLDLMCFVEYGTEVSIDVLTGARV